MKTYNCPECEHLMDEIGRTEYSGLMEMLHCHVCKMTISVYGYDIYWKTKNHIMKLRSCYSCRYSEQDHFNNTVCAKTHMESECIKNNLKHWRMKNGKIQLP